MHDASTVLMLAGQATLADHGAALRGRGLSVIACADVNALLAELERHEAVAVLDVDALDRAGLTRLAAWAAGHDGAADLPILFAVARTAPALDPALAEIRLVQPNLAPLAFASAVRHALRDRQRQSSRALELADAQRSLMAEAAERERAEQRLEQSQKMEAVGRLTGGIAHDFNNLLSAVMGNVELLRARLTDERSIRLADNAMTAVERGAKLTGQLLAFSRMQRLHLAPIDPARLLAGMRVSLERLLGLDTALHLAVSPDSGLAMADAHQLELALLNLAANARDAMPGGGTLSIDVRADDGAWPSSGGPGQYVVFTLTDTGAGMTPEVRERAFEPFYTTKSVGAGSGLGLSQVYGIAKQSGGVVTIDSAPGAGTSVRLLLRRAELAEPERPIAHATPDALDPVAGLPPDRAPAKRERVLVVDDDPDVRRFMVESLDALGYGVTEADHGQAGLDQLDRNAPDLMILDFAMPGMNGAVVADEALRRRPNLPILFATGYADTDAIVGKLRDLPLLRKPFRIAELAMAVAGALAMTAKAAGN